MRDSIAHLTFLNRSAFPDVTSVSTIESESDWVPRVYAAAKDDPRLRIRHVPEPIERVLPELDLADYDLILVDSSTEAARRAALIGGLADRSTGAVSLSFMTLKLTRTSGPPKGS